jgi:hypothetical protein
MQLDDRGLWIDPGPIGPDYGSQLPYAADASPDLFLAPFTTHPLSEALGAEEVPAGQVELPENREAAPNDLRAPLPDDSGAPRRPGAGEDLPPPAARRAPRGNATPVLFSAPRPQETGAEGRHSQRAAQRPAQEAAALQVAPLPDVQAPR